MNQIIPLSQSTIGGVVVQTANARDLHSFMESKQQFADWIKNRIDQYSFVEGQDFTVHKSMNGRATVINYHIAIDMAKELSMVERNAKGKEARRDIPPYVPESQMNQITPTPVSSLTVIEYQGKRVVTFAMIDAVHGRVEGTAGRNFRTNRERLIEGEDFYVLDYKGVDEFRRSYPGAVAASATSLYLITESGYMMLVKSLNDDLAWGVQRQLVKQYFRQPGSLYFQAIW